MADRTRQPRAPAGMLDALPEPARARLLAHAHEIEVPRGGMVYREGGPPRCVLVRSGLVRVFTRSTQGRQVTVRYARPGDLLGVATAVAGPSPVAAQALLDSTLLFLDTSALADEARRDARVAWAVAEELGRRLYAAMDQIANNAFGSVRERIARHLLDAATPGKQGQLVADVTQQQLADAVGSAREVVARTLRSLRGQGLLRTRPGGVVLLRAESLARIAEGEGEPERV
ncbi:MAG TPA: Crp/Fnr family transcriptional regulator [Anaeromyxobacteraceae bacterium]|nr:Crp/Fnr family transcriptional regulator [Anaeromyxobacteraceae bacterium]